MTYEYQIGGIFLSSIVPTVVVSLILTALLRRVLARLGIYRWAWHPALFDTALFLILWDVVVLLSAKV